MKIYGTILERQIKQHKQGCKAVALYYRHEDPPFFSHQDQGKFKQFIWNYPLQKIDTRAPIFFSWGGCML